VGVSKDAPILNGARCACQRPDEASFYGIEKEPHPETAAKQPSRRTHQAHPRCLIPEFPLAIPQDARIYPAVDALARAYGPWWLCNDVTRPFWYSGSPAGPEREVDMVAIPIRAAAPCPDAVLRGTRLRGRGGRATDPSSLS
jgi:hypothetical protein